MIWLLSNQETLYETTNSQFKLYLVRILFLKIKEIITLNIAKE